MSRGKPFRRPNAGPWSLREPLLSDRRYSSEYASICCPAGPIGQRMRYVTQAERGRALLASFAPRLLMAARMWSEGAPDSPERAAGIVDDALAGYSESVGAPGPIGPVYTPRAWQLWPLDGRKGAAPVVALRDAVTHEYYAGLHWSSERARENAALIMWAPQMVFDLRECLSGVWGDVAAATRLRALVKRVEGRWWETVEYCGWPEEMIARYGRV